MSERQKKVIVVVDDSEEYADRLWRLLTPQYIVHQITSDLDLNSVKNRIIALNPDVVLTDLMWSTNESLGEDLFRLLSIPTILMSSDPDSLEDIAQAGLEQNKGVFDKMDSADNLFSMIKNLTIRSSQ